MPTPAAPIVLDISADPEDGVYFVTFDVPVTVLSPSPSTLRIGGVTGSWQSFGTAPVIAWAPDLGDPAASLPWLWTGPDPTLSPAPNSSQTGTTA